MALILELYIKGLIFSFLVVAVCAGIYLFAYLVRRTDKTRVERRNRVIDTILIAVLTVPILSFAVLGLLVILRVRNL